MPPSDAASRIAFSIRVVDDGARAIIADDEDTCHICRESFCDDDECRLTMTSLKCCTQAICCGCVTKMAMRCTCNDECDAVIAFCPYCRMVSPLQALDVFLGHTKKCKSCAAADAPATPVTATSNVVSTVANVVTTASDSEYETDDGATGTAATATA